MDGSSTISEVAERTGFTPSALRFYESSGLVTPARTAAGYRNYSEDDVTALHFIGRAKRLGLSLEEIAEIVPLLDGRRCEPVQGQLRAIVLDKIVETRARTADLVAFLGQLRSVAARLGDHTPDGACDDRCGCTSDPVGAGSDRDLATGEWVGATLVDAADRSGEPIACTLGPDEMGDRITAWHRTLSGASPARERIEGGVRVRLPRATDLAELARLIADEQTCCSFFTFALTVSQESVVLDVTAPADGLPMVHALVGEPAWPSTGSGPIAGMSWGPSSAWSASAC
jgi:DNA-binding transcriptional MerR regulator